MLGQAAAHAGARGAHREAETLLQEVLTADVSAEPKPMLHDMMTACDRIIKEQRARIAELESRMTPPPISEAEEMLQWLEERARNSSTGVTITSLGSNFRVLWHHRVGEFFPTLAEALKDAMK